MDKQWDESAQVHLLKIFLIFMGPHPRISTHHNEQDKVEPVPEGVRVLHEVHHVRPALEADDQENGDPGEADVVERDGSVERVEFSWLALCVVLVPVDAFRFVGQTNFQTARGKERNNFIIIQRVKN